MAEENTKIIANIDFILGCLSKNKDPLNIDWHNAANRVGMTLARNV